MKLLLLLGLAVVVSCERKRYDGCDVWTLKPRTEKQLQQLHNFYERYDDESHTKIIFWEEPTSVDHSVEVLACPDGVNALRYFLGYSRISGHITQHNIQRDLDELWARSDARHALSPRVYDPLDFNTFDDIMGYLQDLYNDCQSLDGVFCSLEQIGSSYQGRPLMMFRITKSGSGRRGVFVDALTHCREWLSGATVLEMMGKLVNEYGSNPEATRLVDDYNWHFVPVVNPDGYVYTWTSDRMWRKTRSPNQGSACVGTDANRNFDYYWGTPGSSTFPCSDTYRGASAASEAETQVVQAAAEALRGELVLFLTFHTYGEYYLFPYGSSEGGVCMTAPNDADLARVGQATISAIQETYNEGRWVSGSTCRVLYTASGSSQDWAYGVGLVNYSYTPELRGPGFAPGASVIPRSIQENWNGLLAMMSEIEAIEGF